MLVEYKDLHKEKYLSFLRKFSSQDVSLNKPFKYYRQDSTAEIKLWLLMDKQEVVASVTTKKQEYIVNGKKESVFFIKYPVSLGFIDREYNHISLVLISMIRKKFKKSFLLGMGGINSYVEQIFSKFGFVSETIPCFIKPINPLALILFNPIVLRALKLNRKLPKPNRKEYKVKEFSLRYVVSFSSFNFKENYSNISFSLPRNAALLDIQAPNTENCFYKLVFSHNGKDICYITLFESTPRKHRLFGNINIWCLLDIFFIDHEYISYKEINKLIVLAAKDAGVDCLIMNTSSIDTLNYLSKSRWIKIKSNFAIAFSPDLSNKINLEKNMIITRLDGDGPINMGVEL